MTNAENIYKAFGIQKGPWGMSWGKTKDAEGKKLNRRDPAYRRTALVPWGPDAKVNRDHTRFQRPDGSEFGSAPKQQEKPKQKAGGTPKVETNEEMYRAALARSTARGAQHTERGKADMLQGARAADAIPKPKPQTNPFDRTDQTTIKPKGNNPTPKVESMQKAMMSLYKISDGDIPVEKGKSWDRKVGDKVERVARGVGYGGAKTVEAAGKVADLPFNAILRTGRGLYQGVQDAKKSKQQKPEGIAGPRIKPFKPPTKGTAGAASARMKPPQDFKDMQKAMMSLQKISDEDILIEKRGPTKGFGEMGLVTHLDRRFQDAGGRKQETGAELARRKKVDPKTGEDWSGGRQYKRTTFPKNLVTYRGKPETNTEMTDRAKTATQKAGLKYAPKMQKAIISLQKSLDACECDD